MLPAGVLLCVSPGVPRHFARCGPPGLKNLVVDLGPADQPLQLGRQTCPMKGVPWACLDGVYQGTHKDSAFLRQHGTKQLLADLWMSTVVPKSFGSAVSFSFRSRSYDSQAADVSSESHERVHIRTRTVTRLHTPAQHPSARHSAPKAASGVHMPRGPRGLRAPRPP